MSRPTGLSATQSTSDLPTLDLLSELRSNGWSVGAAGGDAYGLLHPEFGSMTIAANMENPERLTVLVDGRQVSYRRARQIARGEA